MDVIPFYKLDTTYTSSIYNSGKWVDGVKTKELEEKIKEYLGVKHVVLTNNGTSALLAAYWVLKNEFREIDVDPYTFPATYQAANVLSYKVNFYRTILREPLHQTKKPILGVVTHLFGQPNPFINSIGRSDFIEDACQAFGTKCNGKYAGTFGKIGCFSFYPTKSLHTCGHAGAVVTNNDDYYRKMKIFIDSGRDKGIMTEHVALNLRIDEIKAEFLLYELCGFDKKISIQRHIAQEFIKVIPSTQPFLTENKGSFHTYATFNLLVDHRERFQKHMKERNIPTIIYYGENMLPNRVRNQYKDITSSIVAIPCRWNLKNSEIKRIRSALRDWFS